MINSLKYTLLLLMVLLVGCSQGNKNPKIIRLAYVMAPGGASHQGAEKFAELVKERSKGELLVRLYPNGILGNDRVLVEGLQLRATDMIITGTAMVGWYIPEYGVLEAPFVFRDYDHLDKVMKGEIGKEIIEALYSRRKIRVLSYLHRGPRYLTTTTKKVQNLSDLQGLKLRVPELPTYIKSWGAFGANPTPLAYTDMFMALKQGVVEGQENPLEVIYTSHLYETQQYIMETKHLLGFYMVAVGEAFSDKFTEAEQHIILQAVQEATSFNNEMVQQYELELRSELEKHGVEFIPVDKSEFENIAKQKLPLVFKEDWAENIYKRISSID